MENTKADSESQPKALPVARKLRLEAYKLRIDRIIAYILIGDSALKGVPKNEVRNIKRCATTHVWDGNSMYYL